MCVVSILCVDTRYNDVEKLDRLAAVQAEVSEVQLVMQDNIDKVASWSGYPLSLVAYQSHHLCY